MRRFFTTPDELTQDEVVITGDEFHHLKNVSRLEVGELVELLDGAGHIARCKIVKLEKRSATLEVLERKLLPRPGFPRVEIVLCLPRFQKMDLIIQKAVELGAAQITPVVSDRSFLKTLTHGLFEKTSRWAKIATEANKQSGRAWPLTIEKPTELSKLISSEQAGRSLFLYEGEGAVDIKTALNSFKEVPESIKVFIGAEGGFSPNEVENFRGHGLMPITMGPLVLRVETACIAILSVIEYHFNLMC